jgi:iron complex outermembrane recepter protein
VKSRCRRCPGEASAWQTPPGQSTSFYIITRDDIRRSGVPTLAEALRLAPNLQVARVNASSYAISARGFNSESANKLLVMIDGRSVYTPLHSGVFWDVQDVMLADIERIEVVSGPGGTLWGANAVNGVINVLTRSAHDSKGGFASVQAGSDQQGAALRQGFGFGDYGAARVYGRTIHFDATRHADGSPADDAWTRRQLGFRADWGPTASNWTAQGDLYDGDAHVSGSPKRKVSGGNLLARYQGQPGSHSAWQAQFYVDSTRRDQPGLFTENLDTIDLDLRMAAAASCWAMVSRHTRTGSRLGAATKRRQSGDWMRG